MYLSVTVTACSTSHLQVTMHFACPVQGLQFTSQDSGCAEEHVMEFLFTTVHERSNALQ